MQHDMLTLLISEYAARLQEEKRLAEASRRSYLGAARSLLTFSSREPERLALPADWTLEHLDKRTLELYLNHLRRERGWRESSLAQHASTLRAFFSYLHDRGLIERNPLRSLHPRAPRATGPLPDGEEGAVQTLLDSAPETLAGARLRLLVELIYGAALRPSHAYAVQSLQAEAEPTGGDGVESSGGRGALEVAWQERTQSLPVSEAGLERARRYLELRGEAAANRPEAPFWVDHRGGGCSPGRLSRELARAMERAGLPGKPSELRQLAARHFRERGGDTRSLQALLGARRLGSLDRYGPTRMQDIVRQFRKAHPRQQERGE